MINSNKSRTSSPQQAAEFLEKVRDKQKSIAIIANGALGDALSGGDRIFIEMARYWTKGKLIKLYISEDGLNMCRRLGVTTVEYIVWSSKRIAKFGLLVNYILRTLRGIFESFRNPVNFDIIYSASDFWPDSIPAFILKLRNPNLKWIAGFYLFASKPWMNSFPYKGKSRITGIFYWLTQLPIYWIVKKYSDMVFVTSEPDINKFITVKKGADKVVVIRGGVDTKSSKAYLNSKDIIPIGKRKYDACFIGRFHPQKGVLELMDIWKILCRQKPNAKLAMIGTGLLEEEMKNRIKGFNLQNNIELLGFRDGEEKYEVFKQSKIVIHPAIYDSGGMAACEAMAWGLPGVSFDLESLKTYYPKGMLKTPCYNLERFAGNIIMLLEDNKLYDRTSKEAIEWAVEWDWGNRIEWILKKII